MRTPLRSNGPNPPTTSWLLSSASAVELSQSTQKLNRNFGIGTLVCWDWDGALGSQASMIFFARPPVGLQCLFRSYRCTSAILLRQARGSCMRADNQFATRAPGCRRIVIAHSRRQLLAEAAIRLDQCPRRNRASKIKNVPHVPKAAAPAIQRSGVPRRSAPRVLTRLPSQYSSPLASLIPKRARPC